MRAVYLFNPENDLALVRDEPHFTPPAPAMLLRSAGQTLPLWYGEHGSQFICTGVNAAWLDNMQNLFGIDIDVFDYEPAGKTPVPWGWSRAVRAIFADYEFTPEQLPDDRSLDKIRSISHRRTSIALHGLLPQQYLTEAAVELNSFQQIEEYVNSQGEAILKLPYSSSGRGVIVVDTMTLERRANEINGMLRNQDSVMAEPRIDKSSDFAFLFHMEQGRADFRGLSLFTTERLGAYSGNIIIPQKEIEQEIIKLSSPEAYNAIKDGLCTALPHIIGSAYSGPVGVDMMTVKDSDRLALCELNLRMTMGHLCLNFQRNYMHPEAHGTFSITDQREPDSYTVKDKRLCTGTLNLNPPGSRLHFLIKIQ